MQRHRFFFNLGLLGAATVLVVASVAFGPEAVVDVGLGVGITGIVMSLWFVASLVHHRILVGSRRLNLFGHTVNLWALLGGSVVGVAIWETVQSAVFGAEVAKWLTLANGLLAAALAFVGLIVHELTTERVVHVLEVVQRPGDRME